MCCFTVCVLLNYNNNNGNLQAVQLIILASYLLGVPELAAWG